VGGKPGMTKRIILDNLDKEDLSAKQLSHRLYLAHSTILEHLNQLKKEDKFKIVAKGHFNESIWSSNSFID